MKKKLLYGVLFLATMTRVHAQEEIRKAAEAYRAAGNRQGAINGEFFQATIKMGANANQFLVYLKPNTNVQDLVSPNPTAFFAGGAPGFAFSLAGTTATFSAANVVFNLGANPGFSVNTEVAGGRSRVSFNTNAATQITLPWNAGEERLAFTLNLTGDDTVGLRLEHDMTVASPFALYIGEQNTFSDWTHYTTPFYTFGTGAVLGTEGVYTYVTLGSSIITPVTMKDYSIKCVDKGTSISWVTTTESNTSHFDIEKSLNGADWIKIDQVSAAGNSSSDRSYSYLDLDGGRAFYRVKQVDLDGRSVYTAVVQVNCEPKKTSVVLFPVPAKDKLTVVVNSTVAVKTDLQVFDMGGKMVRRVPVQVNNGNNNFILNVLDLPSGQYMLTSSDPSIMINKKFTVNR